MTRDSAPAAITPPLPGLGDPRVGEHEVRIPGEPEYGLFAKLGAEAFGTFVLVLAALGVALYAGIGTVGAGALGTALAVGLAWAAGIAVAGHISGGHFNPAVTLGAAVAGRLPWSSLLPYWLAQVVGGAIASALLFIVSASFPALEGNEKVFFSQAANGFREHSPVAAQANGVGFGVLGALVIEIAVTAVLVTVFLGLRSRRAPRSLAPVTAGLTLTAMTLVAIPVTNGSLNPARSTAVALFSEPWALEQLWLFWAAPLVGAAIAGAVAFVLFEPRMTVLELDDEDDPEPARSAEGEDEWDDPDTGAGTGTGARTADDDGDRDGDRDERHRTI